jgi:hypothetical protein
MTEAKAATVAIGPFSSGSGSVALSGFTFGVPFPVGTTDAYAFTLTDNANVSGTFDSLSILDLSIDLNSGLLNLAHTTSHFGFPPIGPFPSIFPPKTGLFSLDLTPGNYLLAFSGTATSFTGTLAFGPASIAATPVPAALLLFVAALGGLGLIGWRRRGTSRAA